MTEGEKLVAFLRSVECEYSPGRIEVRRCRTCGADFQIIPPKYPDPLVERAIECFVPEQHRANCQWVEAMAAAAALRGGITVRDARIRELDAALEIYNKAEHAIATIEGRDTKGD